MSQAEDPSPPPTERRPGRPGAGALGREAPWLGIEAVLLVVLLHANAPEVWFWFAALLLLLLWRTLAWRSRQWQRRQDNGEERPEPRLGPSRRNPGGQPADRPPGA